MAKKKSKRDIWAPAFRLQHYTEFGKPDADE
jgi:hypothetical protein